jgi:hypothetical protein
VRLSLILLNEFAGIQGSLNGTEQTLSHSQETWKWFQLKGRVAPRKGVVNHVYSLILKNLAPRNWETLAREAMLDKCAAARASGFLIDYSKEKGVYMKVNYFNADHTHALIDLPTNKKSLRRKSMSCS